MDSKPSKPSSGAKARARHSSRAADEDVNSKEKEISETTYKSTFVGIAHILGQCICNNVLAPLAQNSCGHHPSLNPSECFQKYISWRIKPIKKKHIYQPQHVQASSVSRLRSTCNQRASPSRRIANQIQNWLGEANQSLDAPIGS